MKKPGKLLTSDTGAKREDKTNKGRPDLISPIMLKRLAILMEEGGLAHGDRSWELGMPLMSFLACTFRHLIQVLNGEEDEDHPIQAIFNLQGYVHTLEKIKDGTLPVKLDDRPWKKATENPGSVVKFNPPADPIEPGEAQYAYCCRKPYKRYVSVVRGVTKFSRHCAYCNKCKRSLAYA